MKLLKIHKAFLIIGLIGLIILSLATVVICLYPDSDSVLNPRNAAMAWLIVYLLIASFFVTSIYWNNNIKKNVASNKLFSYTIIFGIIASIPFLQRLYEIANDYFSPAKPEPADLRDRIGAAIAEAIFKTSKNDRSFFSISDKLFIIIFTCIFLCTIFAIVIKRNTIIKKQNS